MSDGRPRWATALEADPRLEPLPKPPNVPDHWVHAGAGSGGLVADYFVDREARALVGIARFGSRTSGHPNVVHGGAIATLIDDALGTAAWLAGHFVVSLNVGVDFHRFVPVGAWVRIDARVTGVDGRKVRASCAVSSAPDTVHAEGSGLFLQVEPTIEDARSLG